MRGLLMTLAMAAVMALAAGSLLAADGAAAPETKAPAKPAARAPMAGFGEQLGLTDQQKEQIKTILATAKEEAQAATDLQAKIQIFKDAMEKINTTVLTKEQRDKLAEAGQAVGARVMDRLQGMGQQWGLTPEQAEAAKKILQAAAEAAKQAPDLQAKMKIMQDAMEQVRATVLTDEQRAKMQQGQEQLKQKMEQMRTKMKERRAQQDQAPAAAPKE